MYRANAAKLVKKINKAQNSWRAVNYPQFRGMTIEDMKQMTGGRQNTLTKSVTIKRHEYLRVCKAEILVVLKRARTSVHKHLRL